MSAQRKAVRLAKRQNAVSRREFLAGAAGLAAYSVLPAWARPRHGLAIPTGGGGGGAFNFFISPTGSDSNAGTMASPWAITSLQDTNSNNSLIHGQRIGLIAGTYNVSALASGSQPGDFAHPALHLPAGTSSASTYVASCDTSGNYSARAAILSCGTNATPGSIIGQNPSLNGYWTVDGIVFDCGGSGPGTFGLVNSPIAYFPSGLSAGPAVVQNCEFKNFTSSAISGNNISYIFMEDAGNSVITNNYFHDFYRPGDPFHAHAIENYGCNGSTISFNTFYNCPVHIDFKVSDVAANVFGNYFGLATSLLSGGPSALVGFDGDQLAQANVANVVHHNVIDSTHVRINDVPGSIGQSLTFYNNTVYDTSGNSSSVLNLVTNGTGNVSTVYNNILVCNGSSNAAGNYSLGAAANWAISDYNCFAFSTLSQAWGTGYPSGSTFNTLTGAGSWSASTGTPDTHSIAAASLTLPQFASSIAAGGAGGPTQFQLGGASPCLNAGKTGGIPAGTTVNMGAWDGTYATIGANWVIYPAT